MQKEELRTIIKNRINALTKEECSFFSKIIADKLWSTDEYKRANTIFVYNSFGYEVETDFIIKKAISDKKSVCLPITEGNLMYAVKVDADTLYKMNDWGISEPIADIMISPSDIDLSVIPLVGFDRSGNRLGRGKGFYDRYLTGIASAKIALAYSVQEAEKITADVFDVKVDVIITENEVIQVALA